MRDETTVDPRSANGDTCEPLESPEAPESVTDVLDALNRAGFEAWWTRVHGSSNSHEPAGGTRHRARNS